jgi:hypothetical protein
MGRKGGGFRAHMPMSGTIRWRHNSNTGNWKTTVGEWRAAVLHLTASGDWYPYVERTAPPHDWHDRPHFERASEARDWC